MTTVFISYARADGLDAAAALRSQLTDAGLTVWRDLEEMRGGRAWKEQLRAALRRVDAVVVLLTPGAVASPTVEWEWENALTLQKPLLPLLIQPCAVPAELQRLHYHDLSTPERHTANFPKLLRDLYRLPTNLEETGESNMQQSSGGGSKYSVGTAYNSSIGDNATTLNVQGQTDPQQLQQALALWQQLRRSSPGSDSQLAQNVAAILARTERIDSNVEKLLAGQLRILARFDESEQQLLTAIVAQLNAQQAQTVDAILDVIDVQGVAADELGRMLTDIQHALAAIQPRVGLDPQLARRIEQIHAAVQPADEEAGADVRHRLKLSVPLLPFLLAYEGEIEVNARRELQQVWDRLQTRLRR